MSHRLLRVLLPALCIFSAQLFSFSALPAQAASLSLSQMHVCIDPGHGGSDPGTVSGSLRESDILLDIAQALRVILRSNTAQVTLTRASDLDLNGANRYAICNAAGAHVLISIHLGGSRSPALDGAVTRYFDNAGDKALAEKMQQGMLSPALGALGSGSPFVDFGLDKNTSVLLRKSTMPAAQIEPVLLTNVAESAALAQRAYDPATGALDGACNVSGAPCRRLQIAHAVHFGLLLYSGSTP